MRRLEELPGNKETILRFIEENKKLWKPIEHKVDTIYVNLSMVRLQFGWIIPKLVYAKGLEEETKAKVVVLTWRENPLFTQVVESFGFHHISIDSLNRKSFISFIKAFLKTMKCILLDGNGENLKRLKASGINVGKNLYEDILRTSSLSTITSTRNIVCMKKVMHLIWTFYSIEKQILKDKPAYLICDDLAYHEGMLIKLFYKYGASICNVSSEGEEIITVKSNGDILTRSEQKSHLFASKIDQLDESSIIWSEKYLVERYAGKNGRNIDRGAFKDKQILTREEAQEKYGLDVSKKNIIIMAHTFTDAVFNYGDLFYRDYYEWTEQTLKFASKNGKVNWILKPHPTRGAYNESIDSIEKMYERNKKPNIFLLSDDVSAESIKNIADVIVTIGGNAGIEFACEGIPAVIIGKPYYQGFGFTIEPRNKEEYEKCLSKIEQIAPLDNEQVKKAKKIFYLNYSPSEVCFSDEFGKLISREYGNMTDTIALKYFASNEGTDYYNTKLIEIITSYIISHNMTKCEYFIHGKLHGRS